MTCPTSVPDRVTEQVCFASVHSAEAKLTAPLPLCDQITWDVGEYPATLAVHVMVTEPKAADLGEQVTDVFVDFAVTVRE